MANFYDLIKDIHAYLAGDLGHEDFRVDGKTASNVIDFAKRVATHTLELTDHTPRGPKPTTLSTVRMSELGAPCLKQLHYKWYDPSLGLPPYAEKGNPTLPVKFLFGDYMEELVLHLAKEAGHEVTDRQKEVYLEKDGHKAIGHLDAVIDGVLVDVKSAADVSFQKYKREGLTEANDSFGYRWQLDSYALARGDTRRAFIFINKHDGELLLIDRSREDFLDVFKRLNHAFMGAPERRKPVEDAKGYGKKLDVVCSYCAFKWNCQDINTAAIVNGRPVYYTELTTKGVTALADKQQITPPEAYR